MKKWISFFCHLVIIVVLTSFGYNATISEEVILSKTAKVTQNILVEYPKPQDQVSLFNTNVVFLKKGFLGFKEEVAFKESQGDYSAVNTLGYLGKYQFGSSTLQLLGVHDINEFLNNPILQENVFELNISRNKWILRRDIKQFSGKRIRGIVISESGILAAAHLAGAGNVKKYLRSYGRNDYADAYGTNIAFYMKKFSGYDISSIKTVHNPRI